MYLLFSNLANLELADTGLFAAYRLLPLTAFYLIFHFSLLFRRDGVMYFKQDRIADEVVAGVFTTGCPDFSGFLLTLGYYKLTRTRLNKKYNLKISEQIGMCPRSCKPNFVFFSDKFPN